MEWNWVQQQVFLYTLFPIATWDNGDVPSEQFHGHEYIFLLFFLLIHTFFLLAFALLLIMLPHFPLSLFLFYFLYGFMIFLFISSLIHSSCSLSSFFFDTLIFLTRKSTCNNLTTKPRVKEKKRRISIVYLALSSYLSIFVLWYRHALLRECGNKLNFLRNVIRYNQNKEIWWNGWWFLLFSLSFSVFLSFILAARKYLRMMNEWKRQAITTSKMETWQKMCIHQWGCHQ